MHHTVHVKGVHSQGGCIASPPTGETTHLYMCSGSSRKHVSVVKEPGKIQGNIWGRSWWQNLGGQIQKEMEKEKEYKISKTGVIHTPEVRGVMVPRTLTPHTPMHILDAMLLQGPSRGPPLLLFCLMPLPDPCCSLSPPVK